MDSTEPGKYHDINIKRYSKTPPLSEGKALHEILWK